MLTLAQTGSDWQDVLIAYVPVVLIVLGGFGLTRNHLKQQDAVQEHRNGQVEDIQKELAYIKKCVNGEGFNEKTGYKL